MVHYVEKQQDKNTIQVLYTELCGSFINIISWAIIQGVIQLHYDMISNMTHKG